MSNERKKGLLVVVSGPSGAGKGTVLAHAIRNYPNLQYSVSVTTREPRPGEVDGINYYFVTKDRFKEMLVGGELLEHQQVYGNYYGTPKQKVLDKL